MKSEFLGIVDYGSPLPGSDAERRWEIKRQIAGMKSVLCAFRRDANVR